MSVYGCQDTYGRKRQESIYIRQKLFVRMYIDKCRMYIDLRQYTYGASMYMVTTGYKSQYTYCTVNMYIEQENSTNLDTRYIR